MKRLMCLVRGHLPSTWLGCINPHGHWPFPATRDACDECRAIRVRYGCVRCGKRPL